MSEPLISETALWATCAQSVGELLQDIARTEVLPRWHRLQVDLKSDGSLLSDADRAVQQALANALPELYPAALLGEESAAAEHDALWPQAASASTTLWIADPIDGTTNFVSGLPWYALSVALVHQGQTVVGVTYAPALDCLWHASLDGGAFLNGQRLQLGQAPGKESKSLRNALIGVDMTYLPEPLRQAIANISPSGLTRDATQSSSWRGWRSLGASTLEWCALASGQIQAYVHGGQMPWDAAAGRLILAEAGGCSAPLHQVLGQSPRIGTRQPTAYAGATAGIWPTWQTWLREHTG